MKRNERNKRMSLAAPLQESLGTPDSQMKGKKKTEQA